MNWITTVEIRGEEWTLVETAGGEHWLQTFSKEPNVPREPTKGLRYPYDLSHEEVIVVDAAWELVRAEREKDREKSRIAGERMRAREREEFRQVAEGAAWIRHHAWHVEEDHIWRTDSILSEKNGWIVGTVKLNFSELTNDELASVMQAKEREVLNRGVGGFFRRLLGRQ
jgi:hypothetical protein